MISFKQYITEVKTETKKLKHLSHLEDLVFEEGYSGLADAIESIQMYLDPLSVSSGKTTLTTKWDGCLHKDTIVKTNFGEIELIKLIELHQKGNECYVYSYDLESNIPHQKYSKVLNSSVSESDKKWVSVETEYGSIIMTEDHEVYTQRGWVAAKNLTENDDIFSIK